MKFIDVVFDGPPGPTCGRFVEVENDAGASISFGEWVEREDGYWALRIPDTADALGLKDKVLNAVIEECQKKISASNNRQDFAIHLQNLAEQGLAPAGDTVPCQMHMYVDTTVPGVGIESRCLYCNEPETVEDSGS